VSLSAQLALSSVSHPTCSENDDNDQEEEDNDDDMGYGDESFEDEAGEAPDDDLVTGISTDILVDLERSRSLRGGPARNAPASNEPASTAPAHLPPLPAAPLASSSAFQVTAARLEASGRARTDNGGNLGVAASNDDDDDDDEIIDEVEMIEDFDGSEDFDAPDSPEVRPSASTHRHGGSGGLDLSDDEGDEDDESLSSTVALKIPPLPAVVTRLQPCRSDDDSAADSAAESGMTASLEEQIAQAHRSVRGGQPSPLLARRLQEDGDVGMAAAKGQGKRP
jgi:hypothetical protein